MCYYLVLDLSYNPHFCLRHFYLAIQHCIHFIYQYNSFIIYQSLVSFTCSILYVISSTSNLLDYWYYLSRIFLNSSFKFATSSGFKEFESVFEALDVTPFFFLDEKSVVQNLYSKNIVTATPTTGHFNHNNYK